MWHNVIFRIFSETIGDIEMPFGTRILQACQHGKTYFSIDLSELDQGHVGSPKVTDLLH